MEKYVVSTEEAIRLLNEGKVGVMPTDTVYGIVARAHDPQAVTKLYRLKRRERKPGTLVAASLTQLQELGVPSNYLTTLVPHWPGPLSAVLPVDKNFSYLHQGVGDIAMRVVADEKVRHILEATGPLVTSSANQPGEPGSTTIAEAWSYFGTTVDFYLDGGELSDRPPSTIIKLLENGDIEIIRQGAVIL